MAAATLAFVEFLQSALYSKYYLIYSSQRPFNIHVTTAAQFSVYIQELKPQRLTNQDVVEPEKDPGSIHKALGWADGSLCLLHCSPGCTT